MPQEETQEARQTGTSVKAGLLSRTACHVPGEQGPAWVGSAEGLGSMESHLTGSLTGLLQAAGLWQTEGGIR